jgi:serine/threonine protein kinase
MQCQLDISAKHRFQHRPIRDLHSQNVIHRDLSLNNILLDWDWNVRIADFGHSISLDNPNPPSLLQPNPNEVFPSGDVHYLAPERFANLCFQKSDVFSFGMIVYELLTGELAFPKEMPLIKIAFRISIDDERPVIPASVLPSARNLIMKCWAKEPGHRPSFDEIVDELKGMKFKMMPNVNSQKLIAFVNKIKHLEGRNVTDPQ